jgi:hypothetical protein
MPVVANFCEEITQILSFALDGCSAESLPVVVIFTSEVFASFRRILSFLLSYRGIQFYVQWFGEAEKYVKAVFTLASKISPSVIFIDEVRCLGLWNWPDASGND